MQTNDDVISDALSLIGIIAETENLTPEQGRLCLRVLNNMMAEWANRGIDVGHWPQTDTTAAFPAPEDLNLAIQSNLAVRYSPHFQRPLPPVVAADAITTFDRLLRDVMVARVQPVCMDHMPLNATIDGAISIDITAP